jgi:hypothetical protein
VPAGGARASSITRTTTATTTPQARAGRRWARFSCCTLGPTRGTAAEPHSSKPGAVSKGKLTANVFFSTTGSFRKPLAKVVIKGEFVTFPGSKPVFQGTARTTLVVEGADASCNGQESFEATKK